jgi:hypothetical protein
MKDPIVQQLAGLHGRACGDLDYTKNCWVCWGEMLEEIEKLKKENADLKRRPQ